MVETDKTGKKATIAEETEQTTSTMTPAEYLMLGEFPDLKKMSKEALKVETSMWRRLWEWTPKEVAYYIARVNTMMALTGRNYKRQIGTLQQTRWTLDSIEIKAIEKVHDYRDGQVYFEKKTMIVKSGGIQNIAFIHERLTEAQIEKKYGQPSPPLGLES